MPLISLPLDQTSLDLVNDRGALHRYVMSREPLHVETASPRATLGVQFRVDLPGDVMSTDANQIQIRWRSRNLDRLVAEPGEHRLAVRLSTQRRHESRVVGAWSDDEAFDRFAELVRRHGFDLDESLGNPIEIGPTMTRVRTYCRDFALRAIVTDLDAAQAAFDNGLGREKNYGFGMLVAIP